MGISATIPFSAEEADRLSVDAIEEMRLRTWARKNYIEVSQRDDLWHPVILDEMLRIDQEKSQLLGSAAKNSFKGTIASPTLSYLIQIDLETLQLSVSFKT